MAEAGPLLEHCTCIHCRVSVQRPSRTLERWAVCAGDPTVGICDTCADNICRQALESSLIAYLRSTGHE